MWNRMGATVMRHIAYIIMMAVVLTTQESGATLHLPLVKAEAAVQTRAEREQMLGIKRITICVRTADELIQLFFKVGAGQATRMEIDEYVDCSNGIVRPTRRP